MRTRGIDGKVRAAPLINDRPGMIAEKMGEHAALAWNKGRFQVQGNGNFRDSFGFGGGFRIFRVNVISKLAAVRNQRLQKLRFFGVVGFERLGGPDSAEVD